MKIDFLLAKYRSLPVTVKASLWFVICSILQKGFALVTTPIFTRLMTTEQFGFYNTFISWYGILLIFTSLSLYYGVFNNAMVRFATERDTYISSMQGVCITITLFLFLLYLPSRNIINHLLGMTTPVVLLLFLKLLMAPSMEFWLARNRFEFNYKKVVLIVLSEAFFSVSIGVLAVLVSTDKAFARIFSYVLIDFVFCFTIFLIQQFNGKKFYHKEFWKYAIVFNLPLIPHYLSGVILSQGDRVMIASYCGGSAVAFYSVAYNIGILINIIINAINASVTPWIYGKLKDEKFGEIKKITNMLCVLMLAVIVILILFAPEALFIIATQEYAEAVYVIPPVAASTLFTFMYNVFANVEFYYGERKYVSIGSISAAAINIVLNAIFIPKYGYIAAAYTTLFCYIVYGLSHLWFSNIVLRKNRIAENSFDLKCILSISIVSIMITFFSDFLYTNNYLRYAVVVLLLICIIIFRNIIIELVKTIKKKG